MGGDLGRDESPDLVVAQAVAVLRQEAHLRHLDPPPHVAAGATVVVIPGRGPPPAASGWRLLAGAGLARGRLGRLSGTLFLDDEEFVEHAHKVIANLGRRDLEVQGPLLVHDGDDLVLLARRRLLDVFHTIGFGVEGVLLLGAGEGAAGHVHVDGALLGALSRTLVPDHGNE